MATPSKVPLCQLPTPLHPLPGMAARLGLDLWIKRDDLTGFAMGGNKGRKLEYLIAEATAQNAEVVVTCGASQSNFVRQLGAACAVSGLRCVAAVMELPYEDEMPLGERLGPTGNPTLNDLLNVETHTYPNDTWETLYDHAEELARALEAEGLRVYRIPIGGSSPLGAYAFYRAATEIDSTFDWIVTATSSGSTQTGLAYAFADTATKVLGIGCDPEPEIVHDFAALGERLADLIGTPRRLAPEEFRIDLDFVGPGYGVPSPAGDAAIRALAGSDGVFLDPIYSGKAFAGLMDLAKRGRIGGRVLFWHTGGVPSLFAR